MPTTPSRYLPLLVTCYMLTVGIVILAGGEDRFQSESYAAATILAPHTIWAAWILVAGTLTGVGLWLHRPGLRVIGYTLGTIWSFFFAASYALSAYHNPFAGLIGIVAFGFIGLLLAGFARAARGPRRRG